MEEYSQHRASHYSSSINKKIGNKNKVTDHPDQTLQDGIQNSPTGICLGGTYGSK